MALIDSQHVPEVGKRSGGSCGVREVRVGVEVHRERHDDHQPMFAAEVQESTESVAVTAREGGEGAWCREEGGEEWMRWRGREHRCSGQWGYAVDNGATQWTVAGMQCTVGGMQGTLGVVDSGGYAVCPLQQARPWAGSPPQTHAH